MLPIDIDRAMAGEYALEAEKRNLQLVTRAHIEVQQLIDRSEMPFLFCRSTASAGYMKNSAAGYPMSCSPSVIQTRAIKMVPGQLRTRHVNSLT
ncbi:hypothetical protein [Rhizobium leguminosarum]|uniref:hypothetical protein n=1 Tax=Rhizobium leguminosarum TaxID=384 RepID=UPI002F951AA9